MPFVLILVLALCACTPFAPSTEQPQLEPTTLKVGTKPYLSYAPFFIAKEEGYFAEQGLEIEFVDLDPQTTLPAVMQGEVDVTAGLVSAGLFNGISRGGRMRIVADKGYVDPADCAFFALVGRQTLVEVGEASDPAHFRGKQVDVLGGSWHNYYLDELMATIVLTTEDLSLTNLPALSERCGRREDRLVKLEFVCEFVASALVDPHVQTHGFAVDFATVDLGQVGNDPALENLGADFGPLGQPPGARVGSWRFIAGARAAGTLSRAHDA